MSNFADRLIDTIEKKSSSIVVGLDPMISEFPPFFLEWGKKKFGKRRYGVVSLIKEYMKMVIDCVSNYVVAVKPQAAFFEVYGADGMAVLEELICYAKQNELIVIEDCKRGDISSTAAAYATGHLGGTVDLFGNRITGFDVDAITVNPYLGSDSVQPFIDIAEQFERGIFVLTKTSNPSAVEFQDQILSSGKSLAITVAEPILHWGSRFIGKYGYSFVGAVVGATYPELGKTIRKILPNVFFLVPGYGTQGASCEDLQYFFNPDGYGALINASRSILYAHKKMVKGVSTFEQLKESIENSVCTMRDEIEKIRRSKR